MKEVEAINKILRVKNQTHSCINLKLLHCKKYYSTKIKPNK